MQRAYLRGQDKDHLDITDVDNLTARQGMGGRGLEWLAVDLCAVATLDMEQPLFVLGVKRYGCVLSGHGFARAEIDVNVSLIVGGVGVSDLGGAAYIDGKFGDVERPVLGGDLGVRLYAIAVSLVLVESIGVVFGGLDSLALEMLRYLGEDVVVISGLVLGVVRRR